MVRNICTDKLCTTATVHFTRLCKHIKKAWKQVENGMELNGYYIMKVSSKAFAIPVLTAMVSNIIKEDAVRIVGLGDSTIDIHCHDSWSTIVTMIILFYYRDSNRHIIIHFP